MIIMSNLMVKLKNGVFKKSLALFLAVLMLIADLGISVFAAAEGEERFCSDKMNSLPIDDVSFFNETTKLPKSCELNRSRFETITHSNGSSEGIFIDEQDCYNKIVAVVKSLQEKVRKEREPKHWGENHYKYVNLPEKMRLTELIYRWVAENIRYDFETYDIVEKDTNGSQASWKPQDAYFVFQTRNGVCEGYARLANLMMRIAKIPCLYVSSICGKNDNCAHAFNAVYINDNVNNRRGWTLIDPTWASPHGSDGNNPNARKSLSGIAKFTFGCFNVFNRNDGYLEALYDELVKCSCDASNINELVKKLNRNVKNILRNLEQIYQEGSHFTKISFYSVAGTVRFQYTADVKVKDVKQYDRDVFNSCVNELTGRSQMSFCSWPTEQADAATAAGDLKKQFNLDGFWFTDSCFLRINDSRQKYRVERYLSTLKTMCSNLIRQNLGNIQRSVKNLNDEINSRLKALNNEYKDIVGFESLNFTLKRERNEIYGNQSVYNVLMLTCKAALTEDEITRRLDKNFSNDSKFLKEKKAKEDEKFFREFFPAFYNPHLSIEQANQKVIKHSYHKLFAFEFSNDFWDQKMNFPRLKEISHEGNAQIEPITPPDNAGPYYIPQELVKYDLEVAVPYNVKVLVLTGNELINLDDAFSLEKITGTSVKYILTPEGQVYENVDGKRGKLIFENVRTDGYNNCYDYNYQNNNNYDIYNDNNTYDNYNNNNGYIYDNNYDTYGNNTYDNYIYDNNGYYYSICGKKEE